VKAIHSTPSIALVALLLCGSTVAQAAAPPAARWTIVHVSDVGQGAWSGWYSQAPWPLRVRFKCQGSAVIVDFVNTDAMHQNVSVHHWDVEATQDALERSMQSSRALQNKSFQLPARQALALPIHRNVCGSATNSFVFGAVLGT
jgi:hypothetical protein